MPASRPFLRLIGVAALALASGYALSAQAASEAVLSGQEVHDLVVAAMQAEGLPGADVPVPAHPMPACDGAVEVTASAQGWSTATLHCASPDWTRSLRTKLRAKPAAQTAAQTAPEPINASHPVVALTHAMAKGDVLTAGDMTTELIAGSDAIATFDDPQKLIGREMKVQLAAGVAVEPRHLAPDYLVRANGPVAITVQSNGFVVGMSGIALQDGAMGDLITVRNVLSGRELQATVTDHETVEVTPNIP